MSMATQRRKLPALLLLCAAVLVHQAGAAAGQPALQGGSRSSSSSLRGDSSRDDDRSGGSSSSRSSDGFDTRTSDTADTARSTHSDEIRNLGKEGSSSTLTVDKDTDIASRKVPPSLLTNPVGWNKLLLSLLGTRRQGLRRDATDSKSLRKATTDSKLSSESQAPRRDTTDSTPSSPSQHSWRRVLTEGVTSGWWLGTGKSPVVTGKSPVVTGESPAVTSPQPSAPTQTSMQAVQDKNSNSATVQPSDVQLAAAPASEAAAAAQDKAPLATVNSAQDNTPLVTVNSSSADTAAAPSVVAPSDSALLPRPQSETVPASAAIAAATATAQDSNALLPRSQSETVSASAAAATSTAAAAAAATATAQDNTLYLPRYQSVLKRTYVALCVSAVDEPDIVEWVEYHRRMGVGRIYVIDQLSQPPMFGLLWDYIQSGFVVYNYVANPGKIQRDVYELCVKWYGPWHRWMGFIDMDEFVVIPTGPSNQSPVGDGVGPSNQTLPEVIPTGASNRTLQQVLQGYEGFNAVALNWRLFGSSGHRTRPKEGVLRSYSSCFPEGDPRGHVKVFADPSRIRDYTHPHYATYIDGRPAVSTDRTPVEGWFSLPARLDVMYLNHYTSKSYDDWRMKVLRKRNTWSPCFMDDFFALNENVTTGNCSLLEMPGDASWTPPARVAQYAAKVQALFPCQKFGDQETIKGLPTSCNESISESDLEPGEKEAPPTGGAESFLSSIFTGDLNMFSRGLAFKSVSTESSDAMQSVAFLGALSFGFLVLLGYSTFRLGRVLIKSLLGKRHP